MILNGTPKKYLKDPPAEVRHRLAAAIADRLNEPDTPLTILGQSSSYLAFLLAELHRETGKQLVVVCDDQATAEQLGQDLHFFLPAGEYGLDSVVQLPEIDQSPYRQGAPPRQEIMAQMSGLTRLNQGLGVRACVTTISCCSRLTVDSSVMNRYCDMIISGDDLDREGFLGRLVEAGYQSVSLVEDPGTFAVRGGLIDIFSPMYPHPLRVDLFGDEVESIRFFDADTQRTFEPLEEAFVAPVREIILRDDVITRAERKLRDVADQLVIPSSSIRRLIEDLQHQLLFYGIESLLPAFHEALVPLASHFPPDAIRVLVGAELFGKRLQELDQRWSGEYESAVNDQQICFPPQELFANADELINDLEQHRGPRLFVRPFEIGEPDPRSVRLSADQHLGLQREIENRRDQEGLLQPFVDRVQSWLNDGLRVRLVAAYRSQAQRWLDLLEPYQLAVDLHEERFGERPRRETAGIELLIGRLSAGFVDRDAGLVLLGYEELFGQKVHKPRARSESPFTTDFQDLRPKDLIVHVDHGIGRYRGLVTLNVGGVDFDFMRIDYKERDKLYVPVAQLNKVQKLTGTNAEKAPPLARLGATTWTRTKGRVKKAVRDMADQLLKLYASREATQGFAFSPPDAHFREFEAAFPYEETPDQERVIAELLVDMTRPRPMDRVVCGDVGYGKTEVAMRGAFKAVLDGKQVAVLCPTTVLAEQHLLSFRDRFHRYPVFVDSLSRFKSKKEQKEVLKGLKTGRIDIVIGTHRLLSKDVKFRDLGLLVVDEEQRFGVAHKERVKELKHQIDILTLTATPIPRTLNMGLSGIRDLSIIATPPQNRLSVVTQVVPHANRVLRDGILRELKRGGQVFYVHNRVRGIMGVADSLQELVPEARIVVAHGQMNETELEKRMLSFMRGETNLMVCTTIIESGIDIPRANTMFIHRADAFGLAQLYQLRGRVGRSRERAYCYLLVPKLDALTSDARQRIGAMQRFSDLGAGFHIATYDLEIRGAGDLLGTAQSGPIAAVGFELYTQLLAEAVAELKGEPQVAVPDPEIKVSVEALIPESYIPDVNVRLILYKKLAGSRSEEELQQTVDEIIDRFRKPPQPVANLIEVMQIKIMARQLGLAVVEQGPNAIAFTLTDNGLPVERVLELCNREPRTYRLTPEMVLLRKLTPAEAQSGLTAVKKALHHLGGHATS